MFGTRLEALECWKWDERSKERLRFCSCTFSFPILSFQTNKWCLFVAHSISYSIFESEQPSLDYKVCMKKITLVASMDWLNPIVLYYSKVQGFCEIGNVQKCVQNFFDTDYSEY